MKKRVVAVVAVIVLLVGASVASIIYMKSGKNDGSKTAYIYRDNELLRTVSLDDVKNPYTFRIEYGDGEYNDILVENGKIKIADASCPDKLCVNMGYISEPLMPITCLPNHLVIRIVNDGEESPSTRWCCVLIISSSGQKHHMEEQVRCLKQEDLLPVNHSVRQSS